MTSRPPPAAAGRKTRWLAGKKFPGTQTPKTPPFFARSPKIHRAQARRRKFELLLKIK
jgi:hypothetical protein